MNNINKGLTIVVALAMIFTLSTSAMAGHGRMNNCDGGKEFRRGHGGRHGGYGMMGLGFLRAAGLTAQQKTQVADILKGYMPDMKAKTEALSTARQAMIDTMTADDASEATVRKSYADVAAAGEALAMLRFNITTDIRKLLTEDQLAAIRVHRAVRTERMQEKQAKRWSEFEKQINKLTQ
jgi:Spy/CpxP family protein refolding chaperone